MSSAIYKLWAPKCALPTCKTPVNYHHKGLKEDGTPWYNWKSFCEHHRTVSTAERDSFINSRGGCENRDARLGWKCGDPTTPSLTIDHWDGNKHNNNQDNLVVLCANCHNQKTKLFKDNMTRYSNANPRFYDFFE